MKFIFQKFRGDTYQQELIDICKKRGHDVLEVGFEQNVELTDELIEFCQHPRFFGEKGVYSIDYSKYYLYFFGSVLFVDRCNKRFCSHDNLLKSSFNIENFLCTKYYPSVMDHLFNDNHAFYLAASVEKLKWQIFRNFNKCATVFMRPNSGEKEFTAGLFDLQYFNKDWASIEDRVSPNDLILVSTPKDIKGEWRFCVNSKNEIITGSTYQYGGKTTVIPSYPQGAYDKCKEVLTSLKAPANLFTVDICEDDDGKFWLLEINSFFSAGLYACDKDKIVEYLEEESNDG